MLWPQCFFIDDQGAFHIRPCRFVLPHRFQQLPQIVEPDSDCGMFWTISFFINLKRTPPQIQSQLVCCPMVQVKASLVQQQPRLFRQRVHIFSFVPSSQQVGQQLTAAFPGS